jgi:hypothetical protein
MIILVFLEQNLVDDASKEKYLYKKKFLNFLKLEREN